MSFHQTWQNIVRDGGGPADGTTITVANSDDNGGSAISRLLANDIGSGNIFTKVVVNGQHRWRQVQNGSTVKNQAYVADTATHGIWSICWEFVYRTPSASGPILRLFADTAYNNNTTSPTIDVNITTVGRMYIRDAVTATNSGSSTGQMADGSEVTMIFSYDVNTNLATVTVWNRTTQTQVLTQNYTIATDVGIGSWDFGVIGNGMLITLDTLAITAGWGDNTGDIVSRQDVVNQPPTATATANNLYPAASQTVTLQGGGQDIDGSIATRQWSVVSWPDGQSDPTSLLQSPNNVNCDFVPPAQGRWAFSYTNTDEDGATSTPASVTLYVHADPSAAPPANRVTLHSATPDASLWTFANAASSLAAVNDTSSASYIESPANSATYAVKRYVMNPYGEGDLSVSMEGHANGGAISRRVRLYQNDGVTLLQEWVSTPPVGSGSLGTITYTVDADKAAAIPDNDLSLRRALILDIGSKI